MDSDEIRTRRSEEIEALQAFYGDQFLPCLNNTEATEETEVSTNGPWFIQLTTHKKSFAPTLEIRLSASYPCQAPTPIIHNVGCHLSSDQKSALIDELMEMYEPEMDVGILWAERCREEFVDCDDAITKEVEAVSDKVDNVALVDTAPPSIELSIKILSFNHLLHGKSHKKEAQLVSTASKMGLVGFITYGTPGIIGILTSSNNSAGVSTTYEDLIDFSKECGQIGKKCAILDATLELGDDGLMTRGQQQQQKSHDKKPKKKGVQNNHQSKGLWPLLVDLLGEDKVSSKQTKEISIQKKGLNTVASCAELKKVLVVEHGIEEVLFQRIIGIA